MWIENIQKLENAAKTSKEYINSIDFVKALELERAEKVQADIQRLEEELQYVTGMSMAYMRGKMPYAFHLGRSDEEEQKKGIAKTLAKYDVSKEEKEYFATIVSYASKITVQKITQNTFRIKAFKLELAKGEINSAVNEMKETFHIGDPNSKNDGSRKSYDEQKNWTISQSEKLNSAVEYYTTGIHGLKQVSEASDLALLSLPKYHNYDERLKNQQEELKKLVSNKTAATERMWAIRNSTGISTWFEKRSLAKQIAQLDERSRTLATRIDKEKEVKIARARIAHFKEIKIENIHNIKLGENSLKNFIRPHAENVPGKLASAKDIGEHEFISRHRAVQYAIDGKSQQAAIPTSENFVTWAKTSIEHRAKDLADNFDRDQIIHKVDCKVVEACLQLHALNSRIANEFDLQPVSDEDYELVTKNVEEQKPNVVENTLKATSSNAAPSLNASQTLSPVDSKTIE